MSSVYLCTITWLVNTQVILSRLTKFTVKIRWVVLVQALELVLVISQTQALVVNYHLDTSTSLITDDARTFRRSRLGCCMRGPRRAHRTTKCDGPWILTYLLRLRVAHRRPADRRPALPTETSTMIYTTSLQYIFITTPTYLYRNTSLSLLKH